MYFSSIINIPAWNRAKWKGTALGFLPDQCMPFMGPTFEDESAARLIFEEWQRNIGAEDIRELIRVAVIQKSRDGSDPSYFVHISANVEVVASEINDDKYFMMTSRYNKMAPVKVSQYLLAFQENFRRLGRYLLVPTVTRHNEAVPLFKLGILKKTIHFRFLDEIKDRNDPDVILVPELAPPPPNLPDVKPDVEPDAERITVILREFEREVMTGGVKVNFDPMILDRLYTVDRDDNGLVVPSSVDPILLALAEMVAQDRFVKMCLSVPLRDVQRGYVDALRARFEPFQALMKDHNIDGDAFARWASEKESFRKDFRKQAEELFQSLTNIWRDTAPVVCFHLERMQTLKAVYGGAGFPLADKRFWSNTLLYADTLVVPDPILNTCFMAKTASPEESLYFQFKHCINALEYVSLATTDMKVPLIVFAPTLTIIHESLMNHVRDNAQEDLAPHMSKLFQYKMANYAEVQSFFNATGNVSTLIKAVKQPRYFLLNSDVPRVPKEQAKESLDYLVGTFDVPNMPENMMLLLSFLGRWMQYETSLAQSSILAGIPIMDAVAPWEYFAWGLEFSGKNASDGNSTQARDMAIQHVLHKGLGEFPFINDISAEALIALRQRGLLNDLRTIIRRGVNELASVSPEVCSEVRSRVVENMRSAIKENEDSIRDLRKQGISIVAEAVGLTAASGLAIAAAMHAPVSIAVSAVLARAFGVKSVRDIGDKGRVLLETVKKRQRNPIGLLFK